MSFINKKDKHAISEAIRMAESRTMGELVVVIAASSDQYRYIPFLWSALIALLVPAMFTIAEIQPAFMNAYDIQILTFIILSLVFQLPIIKMPLIPRSVKYQRASRHAYEQFITQNLHLTEGRTGLLIFISRAEHYVELIADKGLNDVVAPGTWDGVVADLVAGIKSDHARPALLKAIGSCGEILASHFPAEEKNINELPDHLIEV